MGRKGQFGYVNPNDAFDFGTFSTGDSKLIKQVSSYSSLSFFDGKNTINKSICSSDSLVSLLSSDNKAQVFKITQEEDQPSFEEIQVDLNSKNHHLNGTCFFDENLLLTWGHKVNIDLFDLEKNKSKWKSKCGERDELNLVIPILNRDLCIDHSSSSLFVTNGLNTIKMYDISRQRKPVSKFEVKGKEDVRLDQIICDISGKHIYVSDVLGTLSVYDVRKTDVCLKRLRHSFGCYSEISMSTDGLSMATVGLDRHFRGYRMQNGIPVLLCERYLKTKLFSVFVEGNLDDIEKEDAPFAKKLGTGFLDQDPLETETKQKDLHIKDKFDIEKVFPTRKEAIQIKLRNRIKRTIQDEMKREEEKLSLKKVKDSFN